MEYYRLTIPIPKQPWKWIRFRIATILLLVAVLALALAWWRDHQRLAAELYRIQNPSTGWGIEQATGLPNTSGPGDISTAWASATQDDQKEWLILEYDERVVPTAILVHETYNPGAVVKASHYPKWGREKVLWEGTDPTPPTMSMGISRLPVTAGVTTGRIKIYIDSPSVPGWNEIDAVGLECANGEMIWAASADGSSSFGSDPVQPRLITGGGQYFR
jgi:hypothetical protein